MTIAKKLDVKEPMLRDALKSNVDETGLDGVQCRLNSKMTCTNLNEKSYIQD